MKPRHWLLTLKCCTTTRRRGLTKASPAFTLYFQNLDGTQSEFTFILDLTFFLCVCKEKEDWKHLRPPCTLWWASRWIDQVLTRLDVGWKNWMFEELGYDPRANGQALTTGMSGYRDFYYMSVERSNLFMFWLWACSSSCCQSVRRMSFSLWRGLSCLGIATIVDCEIWFPVWHSICQEGQRPEVLEGMRVGPLHLGSIAQRPRWA